MNGNEKNEIDENAKKDELVADDTVAVIKQEECEEITIFLDQNDNKTKVSDEVSDAESRKSNWRN